MILETLATFVVIGAVGAWLAGVVEGFGFGFGPRGALLNLIAGVAGSCAGGWLFNHFRDIQGAGLPGDLIGAAAGATILLFGSGLFLRAASFREPAP